MTTDTNTAIAEFLAKGGVIQQGAYKESGRVDGAIKNPWGSRKAGRPVKTDEVPTLQPDEDNE